MGDGEEKGGWGKGGWGGTPCKPSEQLPGLGIWQPQGCQAVKGPAGGEEGGGGGGGGHLMSLA